MVRVPIEDELARLGSIHLAEEERDGMGESGSSQSVGGQE